MLRLIGFLVMTAVGVGGLIAVDFNMSRQLASAEDEEGLTFREYIGGFSERIAHVTGSAGATNLPGALADMMPRPPEGWTVRPATRDDIDAFLPRDPAEADKDALALVTSIGKPRVARGAEVVSLTYERADRRVVIQAIRYPDLIFTSFMAMQQRFELQMATASLRGRPFMTVRGLDVTEPFLGDGMRARLFVADVGGQIHLRVLAMRRMTDADLVPFFETLHVRAMNAAVVDRQDGLGEVPVIVLASAMAEAERAAYEADIAARAAEAAVRAEEARKTAEAEARAAAEAAAAENGQPAGEGTLPAEGQKPATGFAADCEQGDSGTKRCKVGLGD